MNSVDQKNAFRSQRIDSQRKMIQDTRDDGFKVQEMV